MLGSEVNHSQIVLDSLSGARDADEKTLQSITALSEKLEHLKKTHRAFVDIEFSKDVSSLAEREAFLAIS